MSILSYLFGFIKNSNINKQKSIQVKKKHPEIPVISKGIKRKRKNFKKHDKKYEEKGVNIQNLEKKSKEMQEHAEEIEKSRSALLNILEDITESEKELKLQRRILRDTIEYFLHGIILFGKNEKILLINKKAFEMFGVVEADINNKDYTTLKENKNYLKILEFLKQKQVEEQEMFFNKYYLKINKIAFEKNEEIESLVILNDITKEKENEQAQSDFIALTAHQLRTPLSGIRWTLEMFLDGSLGKIDEEQKKYIQQLSNNSARLIKVVNRFLDVAQIEQGKTVGKKKQVNMIELINSIIKLTNSSLREKNLSLIFEPSTKTDTIINIDEEKIKIVVQNLLENAISYSKKGGKIKISLKNRDKKFIFSIQDNGYGIPKEEQKKIFRKFFRSSNIKRIDTEGSGLGLYVIKNIIETHNGNIWFKSEGEDKGTTFYFTLPF